jgi:hypothetical protein
MITYLTGILDDGTQRDATMPRNTATAVCVPAGETTLFKCRVFYPSGVAVSLAALTGWSAQLAVACSPDPCAQLPTWSFAGSAPLDVTGLGNLLHFEVPAGTFRGAKFGRYWFEVTLRQAANRWQIIRPGVFTLTPAPLNGSSYNPACVTSPFSPFSPFL